MLCELTTIFYHIADNFTNRTSLMMNNFTVMSVLTLNICHSFCTLYCYLQVVYFAWVR